MRVKDTDRWSSRYVFYSLYANYRKGGTREYENKTTGLHNLKTDAYVSRYEVADATNIQQRLICERLDIIAGIIRLRRQELQKLDELIKARFVEMFGGANCPRVRLDNLTLGKGEYGAQSASEPYDPNRPRYVRITDINDDGTLNDDCVSSSNHEDDEQYRLCYGDFLFARMGATVGKTYAYRSGNQIFAGYLIRYQLNLEKVLPEYLFAYTKTDEYLNWVLLNQSGAAQPGINAKKYGSLLIPTADIDRQREFATFVSQVDKSKVIVKIKSTEVLLRNAI